MSVKKIQNNTKITAVIVVTMLIFSSYGYLSLSFRNKTGLIPEAVDESSFLEALNEETVDIGNKNPMETPIIPSSGFIKNLGQVKDESLLYYYSTGGLTVSFAHSRVEFVIDSTQSISPVIFSLTFPGARNIIPVGYKQKTHYLNYFYGDFQLTNVPTYEEIWFYDLYPGIDLRYYISIDGLKYEFIIHPGGDPRSITLKTNPSSRFIIEDHTVSFQTCQSKKIYLQDTKLKVLQQDGLVIPAHFIAKGTEQNCYGFHLSTFDNSQFLVIDPLILSFSSFLGGSGTDRVYDVVVDSYNSTYIIGQTNSLAFPVTPGSSNTTFNGGDSDLFITKLNPLGDSLEFSTYLGGSGEDTGYRLVVDAYNNTYFTGITTSADFPITPNTISGTFNGGTYDIFVTKLNGTGNKLVFSTYMGGDQDDFGRGIIVDGLNNTCITGETESLDFPTTPGAISEAHNGGTSDAFVAKINATGNGFIFSTYLGGEANEIGHDITNDTSNNVYITGETWSSDFPTKQAFDSSLGGNIDAFITKINAAGDNLIFSTFLGGSGVDYGYGIAIDASNDIYITGTTMSLNFPTKNPCSTYSGYFDAFVTKMDATGEKLQFSTYLGGSGEDTGHSIVVDTYNNPYVTGRTASEDFDVTLNAFNRTKSGSYDAFVTKVNASGYNFLFSTYLGGSEKDSGEGIAVDAFNDTYIAGYTLSSNFPTYKAYSNTFSGVEDSFVTKFTIDDQSPNVILDSPTNNTIHFSGTIINITVSDRYLSDVFFNWDGTINQTWTEAYVFRLPAGDGQHILNIFANDRANNWVSKIFTFITDDTPPTVLIISPGPWIYPSITVDISGDAEHYWYNIEGVVSGPWPDTPLPSLDNGTYTLDVYGNDSIGNIAHTSITFTIDTSFAEVTIDSPINTTSPINSTPIVLSGNSISTWYFISGFQSENQTYLPPASFDLPDGTYTLHAYGNNSIGNVTHVSITFTIDTIPPSIEIISPTNSTLTSETIIVDLFGDAKNYWYYIEKLGDKNGFVNQTWTSSVKHHLSNGIFFLHAFGNDSAGHEVHESVTFTIDTTRSTVIIDSPISITYTTNITTIAFSGDASFYLYYIPGVIEVEETWTSPINLTLSDGTYTLIVRGFKPLGKDTVVNVTFTIDTTPPTIIIDSPMNQSYTIGNITISLSTLSDADHYWYYLEGIDSENQTWISNVTRSSLPDGTYTLHVYGNDSVGNVAHTYQTFMIETPIPTSFPSIPQTTQTTNTTGTSTTTSRPGSFPHFFTVLIFLVTLTLFIRRHKRLKK